MRYLRIIFIVISSLFLLVVIAGFVVARFYENDIKNYFTQRLNSQLNTKIIISPQNIHFSVLKNFPSASLEFYDVIAMDALPGAKDTLFNAHTISMQFNLIDIYRNKYKIKKLLVEGGSINIRIDNKGRDNYHFWKTNADTSSASNVSFELERVIFKKINFSYADVKEKQNHSLYVSNATLSGKFSDENYTLTSSSELKINHIKSDTLTYLSDKQVSLHFEMDVNSTLYKIYSAELKIADLKLQLSGKVTDKSEAYITDVTVKGKDMDIQSVFSLFPESQRAQLSDYQSEGDFYFNANIKGVWSKDELPRLKASFGVNNGELTQISTDITLKKIMLEGEYTNKPYGKKYEQIIDVKKLSLMISGGRVEGNFKISDTGLPTIEATLRGEAELNDIVSLLKIDTLENVSGNLKVNAMYKGIYRSNGAYTAADYRNAEITGNISLSNASCKIKNSTTQINNLNGDIVINNSDFIINSLKGEALNSDFLIDGTFKNVIPFIFIEKELLLVNANFISQQLDLNELLSDKQEGSSTDYSVRLSEYIQADLNTQIKYLRFGKFEANDITGRVYLKNKKLVADPLSFKAVDGEIVISGMLDASQDNSLLITCDASLKKLNINKLFYQCDNFGQDVMVDKNLKGFITSDIKFASVWSPALEVDMDKIYAYAEILIEKGELIKFEPLKELSRFVKLSELENVKFSTLKNTIEIKKQKIYVPKMEVSSSALNITCSGTHTFNNEIDYHIKILLNELLSKKARNAKKENDEFGVVEDDGLGKTALFFSMTGTVDEPIIKYDRKGAKEKLKEDIKVEKQTLKQILNQEFGWFKKDSTLKNQKKPPASKKENDKFIIQWDEDVEDKKQEDSDF